MQRFIPIYSLIKSLKKAFSIHSFYLLSLKYSSRIIRQRLLFTFIKVFGLSLALCGSLLVILFTKKELTYENFNKNAKRVYRLTINYQSSANERHFAWVYNSDFVSKMLDYFPEINNYVRLVPFKLGRIRHNDEYFTINQAFECDSTFFEVFPIDLVVGSPGKLLNEPRSMVITESLSARIFGDNNSIGQIVTIELGSNSNQKVDYIIKGIIKDFPKNSHLHPEFLITPENNSVFKSWSWVYLLLDNSNEPQRIINEFKNFYAVHVNGDPGQMKLEVFLQNIRDIHLYSNKPNEIESNGNINVIYALLIATLMLLIIAFTNYVNLNIGMVNFCERYLFVTRIYDGTFHILKYFLAESIIVLFSTVTISCFLILFSDFLTKKYLNLDLITGNIILISVVLVVYSILSILMGILPALAKHNSSFRMFTTSRRKSLAKGIIALQFSILSVLIIAVFVIRRQTNFAIESGMGINKENLICLKNVPGDAQKKYEIFKKELLKTNSVESVSGMYVAPGSSAKDIFQFKMEGYILDQTNKADGFIGVFPCDYSFASIFGLKFLEGSNFTKSNRDSEGSGEYIINETAMKRLKCLSPKEIIGKEFELITNIKGIEIPRGKIIGVIKDFHISGIKRKDEPLVFFKRSDMWLSNFIISFGPGMEINAINDIERVWKEIFPGYPIQYEYLNSMYNNIYSAEVLQSSLLTFFTIISLFISSMGLLGITLLSIQKRTKEIGLRKINGASTSGILFMLIIDQFKLIVIAFLIAVPVAILSLNKWLESFAYKIELKCWFFVLAWVAIMLITLFTIFLQSWKASSQNPIESLKHE